MLAVVMVSGTVLSVFPGAFSGEFQLSRSLISFGLPRSHVLFLTIALSCLLRYRRAASVWRWCLLLVVRLDFVHFLLFWTWSCKPAVWSSRSGSSVFVPVLVKVSNWLTNTFPMYCSTVSRSYSLFRSRFCYIWFISVGIFEFRFLVLFLRKGRGNY